MVKTFYLTLGGRGSRTSPPTRSLPPGSLHKCNYAGSIQIGTFYEKKKKKKKRRERLLALHLQTRSLPPGVLHKCKYAGSIQIGLFHENT